MTPQSAEKDAGVVGLSIDPEPHPCQPPDMRRPVQYEVRVGPPWRRRTEVRVHMVAPQIVGVSFDCPVCGSHWHWSFPYAVQGLGHPGVWYRHDYMQTYVTPPGNGDTDA